MSSSNLKIISLSMLSTFLLTFGGCGSSSGCCPDLKKAEDSTQILETLAVSSVEPTATTVEELEQKQVEEEPIPTNIVAINRPPVSVINGITSPNGILGSTLLVNGFSSKDDIGVSTYKWSVNDEIISTSERAEIPLEQPGTYNICLEVTDEDNATHQTCETVIVPTPEEEPIVEDPIVEEPIINIPPVAVINGIVSPEAKVGDILSVDGSLSTDDINITSYQWSVNGLVVSEQEKTDILLDKPGSYNICLDVDDASNETNQVCKRVIVPKPEIILSAPPVAIITGITDNEQRAPGIINVSGITSNDDIGVVSYQWSVNDINTTTQPTTTVDLNIPGTKICLSVKDEDNQTNQTCKNITVVEPSLPKAVVTGLDGVVIKTQCPIIVSANGSNSQSGTISSYQWLLDDVEVSTTQDINISIATEGTHKLCLNVTDSSGAVSEDNCQNIVVHPHDNPIASLTLTDDLTTLPVVNKRLEASQTYSLSCANSKDDCGNPVESCQWNASSYILEADGTKTPYISDCFDDAKHTGHGPATTTILTPSYIKLCGNTARFDHVEVTLTVTDRFGNTTTTTEVYTVNP